MISEVIEDIKLIKKLVSNDLKSRYSGSAFGTIWAYVQPLVTILVFWYVFQLGFRNPPVDNVEYIPWTFFNDGILSSSNSFYEYSYLVKKMKFKVWQIPIIKVVSSLCIHTFFLFFIIGVYFLYGYKFEIAWISIIYYSFCVMALLVGLAYLVSSLSVFLKDNTQIVNIVLQVGFWLTPIFWSESTMTEKVMVVLRKNPLFYVITGYRDAMINGVGFWYKPVGDTVYFWCVTIVIFIIGISVYKRLRDHFADLL